VVGLFEGETPDDDAARPLVESGEAKGGLRKLAVTHEDGRRVIVAGLGKRDEFDHERARVGAAAAAGRARELGARSLSWAVPDGDGVAGFAVMLGPGTEYDSVNYVWFTRRYDSFGYLDRIVVDPSYRRTGVGSSLYDAAEEASARHGRMTLEVYVEPPNDASLAFHRSRGYREVGQLVQPNGKTCGMFAKEL
jgi:predicted GNAT superfamily acetyltransferase